MDTARESWAEGTEAGRQPYIEAAERRIVEWLDGLAGKGPFHADQIARMIERGEHRG